MDHEPRSATAGARHRAGRRSDRGGDERRGSGLRAGRGDTSSVALRPAARVVIVLALAVHGLAAAAAVSAPPAEAHPQRDCLTMFWGEPVVPPYCYDVPHDHPDPPPDPPSDDDPPDDDGSGGGSDPGNGEPNWDGSDDDNEKDRVNYDDEGNRIEHTPESCAEQGLQHDGNLCYDEGSDTDLDLPNKKRSCEDRKQWNPDGNGCVVKAPEDDERSEGCPAGEAFYSTLGCEPPCGPGEVLSGGACHAVRPPLQTPPGSNNPPPPECPVGYSGTPPNCTQGTPEVYVLATTADEGAGTVDVTVTLSHRGTADATVDVSTSDGTATAGADYTAVTSQSVTIAAGAQTATVSVTILDDTAYERGDETFEVTASNAVGGAVLGTDPSGDVTIVDDDVPMVAITGPSEAVEEGDALEFSVTLTRPDGYTDAVTVDYAVASEATGAPLGQRCGRNRDWAVLNSDTTTVTWASGDSDAKTVVVAACTDGVHPEPDETLDVTLSNPTPDDVRLSSDTASGTITSKESYVPGLSLACALRSGDGWDLTFSFPMDSRYFYRWRINGGGWNYGHYGWQDTRVTVVRTVTTSGVHTAEAQRGPGLGNNTYRGTPDKVGAVCEEPPTVSVSDVTVDESAGTADFALTLSRAADSDVTVVAATADGTAHAAATPVAVAYVAARDALIADLDRSGMNQFHGDTFYRNQYRLAAARVRSAHSLDASIPLGEDDPNALPSPHNTQGEQDLKDAIDALAAAAGVPQAMIDNPAATAIDYTAISTTATIAAGSLTADVQVPITDDTSPEPDETFTLTLSNPTYATLGAATATGTIADNDTQVTVGFGQASYTVAEGGSVTVTVTLSADPHRTVVVPISHTPRGGATSADYSGVPASVTFNSGETSTTFTFTATDDTDNDAGESVRLSFGTLPTAVSAGTINEATVSITDDDGAVPTVSVSDVAVVESAGTADFTVTLSAASSVAVTVDVATSDGTATAGSDYTAVTRTVSIAAGSTSATVSVPIADDAVEESHETFTLTLSSPADATLGTASSATGTIVDDESPPPIYR